MTSQEMTHLQRIQEGLPVVACVEAGVLHLSPLDRIDQTWAEFPLHEGDEHREGERIDATVEVFQNGNRLTGQEIQEREIRELLENPRVSVRLVLNHSEDGDPNVEADWRVDGLNVVRRPTLSRSEGQTAWAVARSLPCCELRIYQRNVDGAWTVLKQSGITTDEGDRSDHDALPLNDRYSSHCRGIPPRPLAKPFKVRPISSLKKDDRIESFRM